MFALAAGIALNLSVDAWKLFMICVLMRREKLMQVNALQTVVPE